MEQGDVETAWLHHEILSLVIVFKSHIKSQAVFKGEGNPPIGPYRHTPFIRAIPSERMEFKEMQVQIL